MPLHQFEEHHMLLGQELINVFNPDVLVLFDCGAGEMLKAALSQRVLSVGIVPNKTHKELLMNVLRKFVEGLNLVNVMDGPTKPLPMIRFEAAYPDNEDVKKSVIISSVIGADSMSPSKAPAPPTPKTPAPPTPKTPAPPPVIISSPSSAAASSSQNKSVLQFGTTIL